jgi:arylsulfatase A-like enzyme
MAGPAPNILFIMSDDHAAHAMSCYGSRINVTPNLDRIAGEGMRFDNCFCTNSICTPSRASILTGTYNHVNGATTLATPLDGRQQTFPKLLQAAGYQTAVIGKWHLGHGGNYDPQGFDFWSVLPDQGLYYDPRFLEADGEHIYPGYATDIITERSLEWLAARDRRRPFCLLVHHKAPHLSWEPAARHAALYADHDIPLPDTFDDDYRQRAHAAAAATMRIEHDLTSEDLKAPVPPELAPAEAKQWMYQRYIKDYLRCVAAVDEGVGRLLDFLDDQGLTEDTIVVYTSDQGFFLGDHGWYDKRFMYEESLRMPFVMRYPREIAPGSTSSDMLLNVDFGPTFLDCAGLEIPPEMQGTSFRPLLHGDLPEGWQTSMYYRYWMHAGQHNVCAHYGIRTLRHKLIYYYGDALGQPEWELFDLESDPYELHNVYDDPAYADVVCDLRRELRRLQEKVGDAPHPSESALPSR